jgi:hypothetical protein
LQGKLIFTVRNILFVQKNFRGIGERNHEAEKTDEKITGKQFL